MEILQTNKAYYPKIGGIEKTVQLISEGLKKFSDITVEVLSCYHYRCLKRKEDIINGVKIHYSPTLGVVYSLPLSPFYFKIISEFKADILHIHEPFPLADLSYLLNKKVRNNFNKVIVSWHSDIIRQKFFLYFYKNLLLKFLNKVDRIIVSNENLINSSEFLPNYLNKCEIIPIGTDLNWVQYENEKYDIYLLDLINMLEKPLVLSVGRLVYYKGFEFLINAFSSINKGSLIIVGSGPLLSKLNRLIKSEKLENRVYILPEQPSNNLHFLFKNCDLFVLPSILKTEAYGIVLIEAMACGKPVISTELGTGTSFVNLHNKTGIVVPPSDSKSLADAINKIYTNKDLYHYFSGNAKLRAFSEFTATKMVEKIRDLYLKVN